MDLGEACDLIQVGARTAEAFQTVAQAFKDKAVLENEMREIQSRVEQRRAEEAASVDRITAANAEAERILGDAKADADRLRAEAAAEVEKLVAQASAEASGVETRARQKADKIMADAKAAADLEDNRKVLATAEAQKAGEQLAELNIEIEAASARLDSIKAAIRAAVDSAA